MLGEHAIEDIDRPSMGSEDFAFYLDLAPGAMFRLGCTSPRCGGHALHSPWFDVDEDALRCGAKVLAHAACSWFDPRQR
jgi:amidohydrolase